MKPALRMWLLGCIPFAAFGAVCAGHARLNAGPSHDESITMLAANAREEEYVRRHEAGERPFGLVAPAAEWHRFTRVSAAVSFDRIRRDVLGFDRHPPLGFWCLNRWLAALPPGDYGQARLLMALQMALAGIVLAAAVVRLGGSGRGVVAATALFLLSNSCVSAATFVRQYALLTVWLGFAAALAAMLAESRIRPVAAGFVALLMGAVCLGGMLTAYNFVVLTLPFHAAVLLLLTVRRRWFVLGLLVLGYLAAAGVFFRVLPGVLQQSRTTLELTRDSLHVQPALAGVLTSLVAWPAFAPPVLAVAGGCAVTGALVAGAAWVWRRGSNPAEAWPLRVMVLGLAGIALHAGLVALGVYPAWGMSGRYATSLAFVASACAGATYDRWSHRARRALWLLVAGLFAWQAAAMARRFSTEELASIRFAERLRPDVVVVDDLRRGMLLPLTMCMPADQQVLALSAEDLVRRIREGNARQFGSILFLMEDEVHLRRRAGIQSAFVGDGWSVKDLPTLHPGSHDALWVTRDPGDGG